MASVSVSVMLMVTCGFHLVSYRTALIVSTFWGWILYLCMRSCSSVGCCFMSLHDVFMTGPFSGCDVGRVAKCRAAWCQYLSTSRWKGIRFAMTSRMSVAVVFIAPVIIIVAHLCMDASFLMMAWWFRLLLSHLPTFCCGVRKMSAA
jgi:hypothetical protein